MADGLITQVDRDGRPAVAAGNGDDNRQSGDDEPKQGWFASLFCCCCPKGSSKGGAASDGDLGGIHGKPLLPLASEKYRNRKCLVLDLDETLVHSSFKPVPDADFVVPIEIDGQVHQVYVLKRPHVDTFLKRLGDLFEIVIFTASLSKYADPVTDLLDKHKVVRHRLFREHCVQHRGNYVKDLNRLGRDLSQVVIVDNSPASYVFHPNNAVACESWFEDQNDTELLELIPFFEDMARAEDVWKVLR